MVANCFQQGLIWHSLESSIYYLVHLILVLVRLFIEFVLLIDL
jgi:hypothetical protein